MLQVHALSAQDGEARQGGVSDVHRTGALQHHQVSLPDASLSLHRRPLLAAPSVVPSVTSALCMLLDSHHSHVAVSVR